MALETEWEAIYLDTNMQVVCQNIHQKKLNYMLKI